MQYSKETIIEQEFVVSVKNAVAEARQVTDENYHLLIRFYSDLQRVNSQAYQAKIVIGERPSRAELVTRAALHMYAGQTEGSYFISFSEDIQALLNAINPELHGAEVSWAVRGIIKGMKPELYGKPGMENIARAPAQYLGIFKVRKTDTILWSDPDLTIAVQTLKHNPQYQDLKMNFQVEHEAVAYYPGPIEVPVKQLDNPFYSYYMDQVPKQ
jgi:hypothetical protein